MKYPTVIKNKYKLVSAAILLIVLGIGVYIYRFSNNTSGISPENKIKLTKQEVLEQNETIAFNIVDTTTKEYIIKTYPKATNISLRQEFIGAGFGVINITYMVDNKENTKKVYLMYSNPKWDVIYEDSEQITCKKVRELITTDTVLTSMCTE